MVKNNREKKNLHELRPYRPIAKYNGFSSDWQGKNWKKEIFVILLRKTFFSL